MTEPERVIPRRAVVAWILYDLANVIFSMGVISLYFSLFVRENVGPDRADHVYGIITSVAMGVMFVLSPLLGAMTDRARRRMPFLIWATIIACGATAFLAHGPFWVSALLFVIANGGYQAGVQFYDSLIPEVTTDGNRGRITGLAVGLGYLGSYIAVGMGLWLKSQHAGEPFPFATYFLMIACAFFIFALPCFVWVTERGNPNPRPIFRWSAVTESVAQTIVTLKSGKHYPGLLRFLLGRVFYTDAINTVISFMTLYTVNVAVSTGLTKVQGETQAQFVLMSAITCAILGGVMWGFVVDRIGPKRTLNIVLAIWCCDFTIAALVGLLSLPIAGLYVTACIAGLALGGTWAADRTLMLRLSPPDRVGEFYGLYGMVGRFSAISGPLIWASITYVLVERNRRPGLTEEQLATLTAKGEGVAVVALLLMVLISVFILRKVTDEKRDWSALKTV